MLREGFFKRSPSKFKTMTDHTIDLDKHRGMSAQKATELRRILADVDDAAKALQARQEALEKQLISEPATTWEEAAEKARYLISLFAATPASSDPRRKILIANVLADFDRLGGRK
jgi:hypothetical protein